MKLPKLKARTGFTLVELLITVAIVGLLAVIGVPTYRAFIQKARQAEAKVNLGALYVAEDTFFQEYGSYGDHLTQMGLEIAASDPQNFPGYNFLVPTAHAESVSSSNVRYVFGFPAGDCSDTSTILPDPTSSAGLVISQTNPTYYAADSQSVFCQAIVCDGTPRVCHPACPASLYQNSIGRSTLTICATQGSPAIITGPIDVYSSVPGAYDRFTASASGVIAPGVDLDNPPDISYLDIWTIDQNRVLSNVQSGIR